MTINSEMRISDIPFATHRGKMETWLTRRRVKEMYGPALATWKSARCRLMPDESLRALFTNNAMCDLGLDDHDLGERP